MIVTFRERGSDDLADNLEAAAEKQAEALLKTQCLLNNNNINPKPATTPNISIPAGRENTKQQIVVRRVRSRSPTSQDKTVNTPVSERSNIDCIGLDCEDLEKDATEKDDMVKTASERLRHPSG